MLCVYVLLSVVVTWIRRTELMKQINEDCQNKLELSKFVSHVFTTYSSKRGVFHEKWNLVTLCSFMWSFLCVEKLFTISFHNWDIITVASGRTNINVNCVMVSVKKWESLLCNIRIDIVYMKVVRLFPCNHLHFLHHPHHLKNPWRFLDAPVYSAMSFLIIMPIVNAFAIWPHQYQFKYVMTKIGICLSNHCCMCVSKYMSNINVLCYCVFLVWTVEE